MNILYESYTLKPQSIGETKVYIGTGIGKVYYPGGSYAWKMISK